MRVSILTAVLVGLLAAPSFADEITYLHSKPVKKLKRGVVNVLTAPVELPKNLVEHWKKSKNHPADKLAYTVGGLVKGTASTVGRLGSGAWDVLTFNVPFPKDFEPLVKPDYVFDGKGAE